MTHGKYRTRFWGSVAIGLVLAGVLAIIGLAADLPVLGLLAGVAGVAGLALYEDAFVRAGQSVPLS